MTERLTIPASDDPLGPLLRDLRVISTVYCRSEMRAPWGFGVPDQGLAAFHLVTEGSCWLSVAGDGSPSRLEAGDVVILARGQEHWLRDSPSSPVQWLEDLLDDHPPGDDGRLEMAGSGPVTGLLCGGLALEGAAMEPRLGLVPDVVRVQAADRDTQPAVAATIELLQAEASSRWAGATVVCERLSEVLVAQAIRAELLDDAGRLASGTRVLEDGGVAAALHAIHDDPEADWTLRDLAAIAAQSRSAFSARFRELTGQSPMQYVRHCRLSRAAALLRTSGLPLAEVARRARYQSEFSFSRAFKRTFGVAPGAYRRTGPDAADLATAVDAT